MNAIIKQWAVVLAILAFATGVPAEEMKIATVDLNRVFEDYYKTPAKREELEATKNTYQKEIDAMVADMQKRQEELGKLRDDLDRPEYSNEVREQKRKELQDKLGDFKRRDVDLQDYRRTHARLLENKTQDMRKDLLKDITAVIDQIATEANYTFVFDKSGNTMNLVPTILYAKGSLDITEQVLAKLNAGKPPAGSK